MTAAGTVRLLASAAIASYADEVIDARRGEEPAASKPVAEPTRLCHRSGVSVQVSSG